MSRPCKKRLIGRNAKHRCFKPAGIPLKNINVIEMTLDELEALRLAEVEDLKHEPAAQRLQISRPTFTRILASARKKTATAIIEGRALIIEGGEVKLERTQYSFCKKCGKEFEEPIQNNTYRGCPECNDKLRSSN